MRKLVGSIYGALRFSTVNALRQTIHDGFWAESRNSFDFVASPLKSTFIELSALLDKDLVVFFDEVDSLQGPPMLSFLSQLRAGYILRDETPFPSSIALVGMRNIRDYKAKIRPDSESLGTGSPFNIITEALTLSNFTADEIGALYAQHTEATGQVFGDEAVRRAWFWSEGQPWLVNALAREVVEKILSNDYGPAITARHVDEAADRLMRRRDTHIDSLLARLHEPAVKRFLEPMLAASEEPASASDTVEDGASFKDDLQYCLDLGIIKRADRLRPANPIYASVISRYLIEEVQDDVPNELAGKWMDGKTIDINGLLKEFQGFWAKNSERLFKAVLYHEAAPLALLLAFLQRVVNGGAIVIPEYANGLGRADIVVQYVGRDYVIECKLKDSHKSQAEIRNQLLSYMDRLLTDEGWLVVFDRGPDKSWSEKITWETTIDQKGKTIHVVGC
jgi:hypothetical protein